MEEGCTEFVCAVSVLQSHLSWRTCLKTFQQFKVSYKRKIPQTPWGSFWKRLNFLTGRKRPCVERGRMTWLLKDQTQCGAQISHAMGDVLWEGKPSLTPQVSLQLWQMPRLGSTCLRYSLILNLCVLSSGKSETWWSHSSFPRPPLPPSI